VAVSRPASSDFPASVRIVCLDATDPYRIRGLP
jgi:hypothetical protein